MPYLSVIIATHNRQELAACAVRSLAIQKRRDGNSACALFEILVIDNASTDKTRVGIERLAQSVNNLRYIYESELGVGHARNRGLREAHGDYVLFLDDECTVEPDLVESLCDKLSETQCVLFGGPIYPRYELGEGKPKWFRDSYGSYSVFDSQTPIDEVWLSGANMGGHRESLIEVGAFSTALGPKGGSMVYGEEQELLDRVKDRYGIEAVCYFRDTPVKHLVRPEKFRLRTFLKEAWQRGYWRGRVARYKPGVLGSQATLNIGKAGLLLELIKTPVFRNRHRYPHTQNFIIDVVCPFIRVLGVLTGKAVSSLKR